ncbi:MAG: endo-1,4-beta-xylanase [Lachnospiraceae bacterium]|nr:endo-1,4-beta-xylanase [Lachnospiraceae bacterium]
MKKFKGLLAAALAVTLCLGFLPAKPMQTQAAENLITNGNFDDPNNLEVWNGAGHNGGATVTCEVSDTPIGPDKIMTYGKITNRTSNYNGFAYDVAGLVEDGVVYKYSFWVMLDPEDYKDAPEAQRTVEISPHMRADGKDSYSQGVGGTTRQVLEPGVWTQFTGTFSPSWNGANLEVLALRFLEQGESYGSGPGVKGTYYLTGVELYLPDQEPKLVQTNIVDLKNAVNKKLSGNGEFIVGTGLTQDTLSDIEELGLITKHFNAVTIGNELKPDAMFGYASANPRTETVTFNGEELLVPVLDYSRAERCLNYILKWNSQNPRDIIKVRGHVLLWHSQTPEWFFHENYSLAKPLVSAETMSKRLEWYIATMAEHFTGPDSKYAGMFYAWDVVNEAVSDSSGTYRSDNENSMWWKVYQSNEFIIQAFRFANKYMPADVDLYYNDYNECSVKKSAGIVQLLKDVKAAEGTRIDGMGMQEHNKTMSSPMANDFEKAVRAYAEIVDQIQITEWDVKNSQSFIPTDKGLENEYLKQADYYHSFYEVIQKLRGEGINISGMTFWGVIDTRSWLQDKSTVGGGADGLSIQHPLLFDGGYQAKPAFWAFVDESRFQKMVNPTPTPTIKPTEAPTPTPEPTVEPTLAPSATPVPTEAPATEEPANQDGGVSGAVITAAVVAAVALVAAGVAVALKKKRGK